MDNTVVCIIKPISIKNGLYVGQIIVFMFSGTQSYAYLNLTLKTNLIIKNMLKSVHWRHLRGS